MREVGTRTNLWQMVAYSAGNFPAGLILLVVETWLMRLYCPSPDEVGRSLLLSPETYGRLSVPVLILGAIADPLVGFLSDRTRTRYGRRMPYVFIGTPLLALSFVLLWFPPHDHESVINAIWLALMLTGVHVFFTLVVNPYLALMPELWTDEAQRVRASAWMTAFNAVAQVFAFGVVGMLIANFEHGFAGIGDGFKVGALLCGAVTLLFFLPTMIFIRETPHTTQKEVPFGLVKASLVTLKNPAFVPYIVAGSLLGAAQVLVVETIPYLVKVVVGKGDDWAGYILTGLVLLSAAFIPVVERLAHTFRKRDLFLASLIAFAAVLPLTTMAGRLPLVPPLFHVIACCVLISPALSVGLVIPRAILADIMDHDTAITGFRREAMYNGMEGLIQKIAMAFGFWAVGELFGAFGFSSEEPTGIVLAGAAGGAMALCGAVAFAFYPLKK